MGVPRLTAQLTTLLVLVAAGAFARRVSAVQLQEGSLATASQSRQAPYLCGRCRCGVSGGAIRADIGSQDNGDPFDVVGDLVGGGDAGASGNATATRKRRFVGGEPLRAGRFPWVAAVHLLPPLNGVITGALISNLHVLTSASAIEGVPPRYLRVTLGASALCGLATGGGSAGVNISVARVRPYPGSSVPGDDMAVLRLANAVSFGSTIRPICLPPTERSTYAGRVATLVSFGGNATEPSEAVTEAPAANGTANATTTANATEPGTFFRWRCRPTALLQPVLRPGDCPTSGGGPGCVGSPGAPTLVCPTDVGGLVQVLGARQEVQLIGVLSGGTSCNATALGPAPFARTAPRLAWLLRQTAEGCFCAAP